MEESKDMEWGAGTQQGDTEKDGRVAEGAGRMGSVPSLALSRVPGPSPSPRGAAVLTSLQGGMRN